MENQTESKVIDTVDNSAEVKTVSIKDMLSEEYKENKALANFKSVEDLAKSYLNAQSLVGKKVTDLSPEDIKALNKKFGAPETAAEYNFEADEAFKEKAFKAGLNHVQAQALYETDAKMREELKSLRDSEAEASVVELESIFGADLERNIEIAKKAALELGGEELFKGVFDVEGKRDVKIIKALTEAGKRLFEHASVGAGADLSSAENNLEYVNQRISNYLGDKEFMKKLSNPGAAGHSEAKATITKAYSDRAKLSRN